MGQESTASNVIPLDSRRRPAHVLHEVEPEADADLQAEAFGIVLALITRPSALRAWVADGKRIVSGR